MPQFGTFSSLGTAITLGKQVCFKQDINNAILFTRRVTTYQLYLSKIFPADTVSGSLCRALPKTEKWGALHEEEA